MGTQWQILRICSSLQRELQLLHSLRGGVYSRSPKGGLTLGSNLWGYHYHLRRQGGGHPPPPPPHLPGGGGNTGQQPAAGDKTYSGIGYAMKKLGHTMYNPATIKAKLVVQRGINPTNATSRSSFRDFAISVQQFRVYLAMLGGQPHVTMIHTPGAYCFINPTTSAYEGRKLVFIGDRRATKEPNPVCMPTTKTWEWFSGNMVTNFAAFEDHYATKANHGTLWTPVAGEDTSGAIQVPHMLAIPNVLVDLLHTQGTAITLHEVLVGGICLSARICPCFHDSVDWVRPAELVSWSNTFLLL